jgi:hypothetical protein
MKEREFRRLYAVVCVNKLSSVDICWFPVMHSQCSVSSCYLSSILLVAPPLFLSLSFEPVARALFLETI